MLTILSPAKTLDFDIEPAIPTNSQPGLLAHSEYLIKKLQKLSAKKIAALMDLSPKLADLNYQRFQEFHTPFTTQNAKPAVYVFKGDVYLGLKIEDFTQQEILYTQDHLRILSGLYGLLRPLDLMQPYRLEMGTSFAVTPSKKNLYQYWGDKISIELNTACETAGTDIILNLASQEYFKAVQTKKLKHRVISCEFIDGENDKYKVISFFAKKARGLMAKYVLQNQVKNPDDLRGFDYEGYLYDPNRSNQNQFIFKRDKK